MGEVERDFRHPWHAYFNVHGDPFVVSDLDRPAFTEVAKVNPAPDDYGLANALLIAAAPTLLDLVRDLVDEDECWYDHHGYCQGHNLHEKPCPHERAKALLADLFGRSVAPDA